MTELKISEAGTNEAHCSIAKDLGSYMMAAVPKATIIGFMGTPIAKTEQGEGTFKVFGKDDARGYLDKYSIRESIDDETTLPIRHTMAPSEVTVPADRLDKEFFALAGEDDITDIEELNKILERAVGLRTFLTALSTLKERSDRIIKDLQDRTTTGLAAMDQLAALASERDQTVKAARDSGLSARAFSVFWRLRDDPTLTSAGIDPKVLAVEAENLFARFPNARVNPDERRQLRAALYRPLLALDQAARGRVLDVILPVLLNDAEDS